MQLDITDSQNIQSKIEEAIEIWGHVDVLVNNAGDGYKTMLEEGGYVPVSAKGYVWTLTDHCAQDISADEIIQRACVWDHECHICFASTYEEAKIRHGCDCGK